MAFFAVLAALCVAAPVLAETPAPEGDASDPLELQRDEALETPQAATEREDSEFAYAGLTAEQEATLLQNRFAPQLEAIDADPARALADVVIERIDSPTEALVTLDGEKALLESEVPLQAPEEDGDLHKVELGLEETPDGYEPANPLVDLALPDSAQDPIGIGDDGLAITPVGAGDAAATPIGDEDLLLPAVHEDTSLLLSPIAGGLELSAMLASRKSPQQLSFDVDLPQGASLRPAESGGAEVVGADGEPIATITAPHAVDAQGTEVPATLAVASDSLSIDVPHQELDVAYPLFVDPEINELWGSFANNPGPLSYWHWSWSGVAGAEDYIGRTSCIVTCWGNGLYVRARSNFTYPAGSWGRWWFTAQGSTTYMRRVVLGPINYDAHGCSANEPHGYVGIWNDYSGWVVRSNAFPSGWLNSVDVTNLPPGSRTAFVGIHADSSSKLSCGRDYRLGGASLYLDDPEKPTASAAYGYPTGWVKSGTSFTISAPASDPGLGLKKATVSPKQTVYQEQQLGCDGHYANPCPTSYTFQFPTSEASFDEGEKSVEFSVEDALGKPSNTYAWNMKVDRTPPEIDLAGQLAQATGETEGDAKDSKDKPLPLPVYNLTVNATDGVLNPADGGQKRSGVKKIQVFIDNRSTPEQTWEASSCAAGNCPLSKVFTLKLNELSPDADHYLRVLATDFAGNAPRERKLEFEYIPATGMKDEYVMQYFPLPDGSGDEAEEEHPVRPELTVNLVSGNLAYRQRDLDVEGAAADLELERFYNSLLPESQNTEWGDGWTLSQTPELEIEGGGGEATIVEESGAVESKVDLPASVGDESFDKRLQATVEKVAGGGYELTDESGETGETIAFGPSGRAEEQTNGTAATVDYSYEGGDLAAISVEDPGTAKVDPESLGEEETSPDVAISWSANFATYGSADGQLKEPTDVALTPAGDLWVADRKNNRLQRFGPDGQFLSKFGVAGTAEGQINSPMALAIDAAGNILVAEPFRVQKFTPQGQFLSKFGSGGEQNGQFWMNTGIAVGADGSIWVADETRLQRFSASGQFIERVGASGPGQLAYPRSLDVGPGGEVYVADWENHRIAVFDEDGDYLRAFGSFGSNPGQISEPVELDVDSAGGVWVTERQSGRVQLFDSAGDYIASFGSDGSGAQQFDFEEEEAGIAAEGGRVWVVDGGNDRVAEWVGGNYEPAAEPALTEDDPQLEVDVSEGLVDSVEGEESGAIDYQHSGDLLTAVASDDGETQFAYDSAGRMTKVTLANSTYGEIAYEATYGRVKSVTVAVEGKNPKTTYFTWSDEPRRTTVTPPDAPATTYDIAADGSIFKWWNAKEPPVFDSIAGSLYDPNNRETSTPIPTGAHNLVIQAHDEEGVASIQVIANNDQLVDEHTCTYDPENPTECTTETNEWVTETGNWPPGIVYLEVIAKDRLGESSSQRFWVNIPYTPPPDPEDEEPPRFSDILRFREEFGLDLDLKGDELAINDRIFESMGAWHNPLTPDGEVARASQEKWGVPLRALDVAELEYRNTYISHDGAVIRQWGEQQASSSYAGYYVDHRAGGIVYVGLLGNQAERETLLSSVSSSLTAPAKVQVASGVFVRTEGQLRTIRQAALNELSSSGLSGTVGDVGIDVPSNQIVVSAKSPGSAEAVLAPKFGSVIRVVAGAGPSPRPSKFSRFNSEGPIQAGDYLSTGQAACTAGFGAWDVVEGAKTNGDDTFVPLQLTAGHCFPKGSFVSRGYPKESLVGKVTRSNYSETPNVEPLDAEAIRTSWSEVARTIFINGNKEKGVSGYQTPKPGDIVCLSGTTTNRRLCGPVLGEPVIHKSLASNGGTVESVEIPVGVPVRGGDSGGPAWIAESGNAAGLITGSGSMEYGYGECVEIENNENFRCPFSYITTVQQIVSGAATLYNAEALSKEGAVFPEPLYIGGVTVQK
ncbi:MAG TPA: DUF6531 domain-containing protein [Solirubrobacterales bacterium]|nr:DUF6531 domain-containing protein [Solirubrobacterales bacterium]